MNVLPIINLLPQTHFSTNREHTCKQAPKQTFAQNAFVEVEFLFFFIIPAKQLNSKMYIKVSEIEKGKSSQMYLLPKGLSTL